MPEPTPIDNQHKAVENFLESLADILQKQKYLYWGIFAVNSLYFGMLMMHISGLNSELQIVKNLVMELSR